MPCTINAKLSKTVDLLMKLKKEHGLKIHHFCKLQPFQKLLLLSHLILCRCSTGADPTSLGSATKVRGSGTKFTKKAGKYWVSCTSPTGQYTSRQDMVTTPTRRRVGDIYCTASRRSTTTSPKPLTDKP